MTAPVSVSVIVPAYNAGATLDRCLASLLHQTIPQDAYEVIVVDDGSSDDTLVRARAHPAVRVCAQDHAGQAAARNRGAAVSTGDILLFTDADCAPTGDWIEQMVTALEAPSGGPLGREGAPCPPVVGAKGAYLTRQRSPVARFAQIEYEERYDRLAGLERIDFVDTYAAAYRRDVFLANGGFDERFLVDEDQELSFRLAAQGERLVFAPRARVEHLGHPETAGAYFRRKFRIGYWKVAVLRRHPSKLGHDSHTPPVLKAQMALLALGGLCLLAMPFWPPLGWGAALLAALFLATTVPFVWRAWRRHPAVALLAPLLLVVRSLALGTGFLAGLLARPGGALRRASTPQPGNGSPAAPGAP